jgi:hypothetical protein
MVYIVIEEKPILFTISILFVAKCFHFQMQAHFPFEFPKILYCNLWKNLNWTCQHSKQQIQMLFLKILFGGIHRGDWENDDSKESRPSKSPGKKGLKDDLPPRGRISQQMSEQGNLWQKIWNDAPALPAYEQKPLLDPFRKG